MSTGFIPPVSPIQFDVTSPVAGISTIQPPSSSFGTWFDQQLSAVNQQLALADQGLQRLAVGDAENLHQVMINLEEAKLSVQLFTQVRSRLLEAYQEVMRMQI